MKKIITVFLKGTDYLASLAIVVSATLIVAFLSFSLKKREKTPQTQKAISIMRFRESSDVLLKNQSVANITQLYNMNFFKHTILLCIGSNRGKSVQRVGKNIIIVDIHLPRLFISKTLPNTESIVRYLISLYIQYKIIKEKNINSLIAVGALNRMWNYTMLRWLLPAKLVAQVVANFDLTRTANEKVQVGFSFLHFSYMAYLLRYKIMAQLFYRTSDCVIGYNINNMNSAISNGAHPQKTYLSRIKINESVLNAQTISLRNIYPNTEGKFILSLWSRLEKEKLVEEALLGTIPFLKNNPNSIFFIIGSGTLREKLERITRKNKLTQQVIFCGHQNHNFIKTIAQRSDFVLAPYSGFSLIEAAFFKCPVIAFNIEWHSELIQDDVNGWLVDPRSYNKISDILQHTYNDKDRRNKAQKLYNRAQQMFNLKTIHKNEREILMRICCDN